MKSDNQRLSMSCISAPFPPDGVIKKSASIQHLTPVEDRVSAEIHLQIKIRSIVISALLMTVGSSWVGKKSTAKMKARLTMPYKDKKPIFVKNHLQKSSLIAISLPKLTFANKTVAVSFKRLVHYLFFTMTTMNLCQTVHIVNDPDQKILIDHQWEISDPILACNSQDTLPLQFFSYPDEIANHFHVWDSALPLAIVPQVHHYPELVEWCIERYSSEN